MIALIRTVARRYQLRAWAMVLAWTVVGCSSAAQPTPSPIPFPTGTAGSVPSGLTPASTPPIGAPTPTATLPAPITPSPLPTASAAATPAPTATPVPVGTPTSGWLKDKISSRAYGEFYDFENVLSMVIDPNGALHATGSAGDEIYYLTDATGQWTEERVAAKLAKGADREPGIALLDDGSVAISFTRYSGFICGELDCSPGPSEGIFIVDNQSGTWADPTLTTERKSRHGQLAGRDGQLHLVYERQTAEVSELRYASDGTGSWTSRLLDTEYADTWSMAIASDGKPHVALSISTYDPDLDSVSTEIVYETLADDGTFEKETIAPTDPLTHVRLILDDADQPTVWYAASDRSLEPYGGSGATYVINRGNAGWEQPELVAAHPFEGAAADDRQAVHLIYDVVADIYDDPDADTSGDGLWYDTNRAGAPGTWRVDAGTRAIFHSEGGFQASSAVAIDAQGRPHILFTKFSADGFGEIAGLWHAVGPGY